MKRASPGITSPPRTGDGSWTHYQPKRASPETSPPLAESRTNPTCCPSKRATPRPKRPPAPGRVFWSRYLMKRAFPGTHAPRCGKEATFTDYRSGSPERIRTSRQRSKPSRRNNYRRHPQDTSRPRRDQLQGRQRGGVMENSTFPALGTNISNMETPNVGIH